MNQEQPTQGGESSCATRPPFAFPPRFPLVTRFPPETFQRPARRDMCFDVEHVPVFGRRTVHRTDRRVADRAAPLAWSGVAVEGRIRRAAIALGRVGHQRGPGGVDGVTVYVQGQPLSNTTGPLMFGETCTRSLRRSCRSPSASPSPRACSDGTTLFWTILTTSSRPRPRGPIDHH